MSEELQNDTQGVRGRKVAKTTEVVTGEIVGSHIRVMSADEYREFSKANGTYMGRKEGQKTEMTPEEFVVLSQSGWTPKMMMEKHGITLEELQNVARRVALIQQLKRPITVTEKTIKW